MAKNTGDIPIFIDVTLSLWISKLRRKLKHNIQNFIKKISHIKTNQSLTVTWLNSLISIKTTKPVTRVAQVWDFPPDDSTSRNSLKALHSKAN